MNGSNSLSTNLYFSFFIIKKMKKTIILQDDIAAKHKFTIDDLKQGEEVTMYGVLVGKAQMPIPAGGLIHTFNLKHASEPFQGKLKDYTWQAPDVSAWQNRTFMGYHRADGQVGTQNYWLVIPLVFCENRNFCSKLNGIAF